MTRSEVRSFRRPLIKFWYGASNDEVGCFPCLSRSCNDWLQTAIRLIRLGRRRRTIPPLPTRQGEVGRGSDDQPKFSEENLSRARVGGSLPALLGKALQAVIPSAPIAKFRNVDHIPG